MGEIMDTNQQPKAAYLAQELKAGEWSPNILQNEVALRQCAAEELLRQHAEIETLRAGYDAAECSDRKVVKLDARIKELEAQLDAVGARGVEPLCKYPAKLHQIAEPAREFPAMTPELASILGLMCFQCAVFAQALRAGGRQIKTRAEDEQAAVLHWMLSHYFRHGEEWRTAAANDMQRMQAEAQAKKGAQA